MKVLFDFELFGYAPMDSRMVDILLSIKQQVFIELKDLMPEIEKDGGCVILTITPSICSALYGNSNNVPLIEKAQTILDKLDFETPIKGLGNLEAN